MPAGRALPLFAFEESMNQITRNMRSIGVDPSLGCAEVAADLRERRRPCWKRTWWRCTGTSTSLAAHVVVWTQVTSLVAVGSELEVKLMLARAHRCHEVRRITVVFHLADGHGGPPERTDAACRR